MLIATPTPTPALPPELVFDPDAVVVTVSDGVADTVTAPLPAPITPLLM